MSKDLKEMGLLKEHLSNHQLKFTRQREHILSVFLKMEHITAEQMYRLLAKKDPHIGLATIYRTLNLFCEVGLAQARHFGTQTCTTMCRIRAIMTTSFAPHAARSSSLKTAILKGFRKKWLRVTGSPSRPISLNSTVSAQAVDIDPPPFFC